MSHASLFTRRVRAIAAATAVLLTAGTTAATAASSGASDAAATRTHAAPARGVAALTPGATGSDIGYAVNRPLCSTVVRARHMNCFALKRVPVPANTPGAVAYAKNLVPGMPASSRPDVIGAGPDGGYTPADLAAAYKYDPTTNRRGQLVAVVDWFDDPNIRHDLNRFDVQYGIPTETSSSLRIVNEDGAALPLPSATSGHKSAGETSLDVEAVRAVCNTCRILLVEARNSADINLAIAEDTAAALGATEITNSFGFHEQTEPAIIRDAFDQPGIVVTASTGDDGWFDWDTDNGTGTQAGTLVGTASNAPQFPASEPSVIAVGGTALGIDATGAITEQVVWNENGPDDQIGLNGLPPDPPFAAVPAGPQGAGGGGCSTEFTAPSWQKSYPGYLAAGCSGRRLSADVSMLADPETGFDTYDTWGTGDTGWITVGGTSLASPLVAAMYALAGGSGNAIYPARSLYENAGLHGASDVFDVVATNDGLASGTGFCGGDAPAGCSGVVNSMTGGAHTSPNALGHQNIDCSYDRSGADTASVTASSECNAVTGFDGPTGVGTPLTTGLFKSTSPSLSIRRPRSLRLNHSATFALSAAPRLSGAVMKSIKVFWGDGHSSTGTSLTRTHTYTKRGLHVVVAVATDSLGQQSIASTPITVGKRAVIKVSGPSRVRHGHRALFDVRVSDSNTGAKVRSIVWKWGDGKTSHGLGPSHTWHKRGRYTVRVIVVDSTGVKTTYVRHERVT